MDRPSPLRKFIGMLLLLSTAGLIPLVSLIQTLFG